MGYADQLFDLTGQVVLITGGSRGLGREMAFGAARCGADVVIASRKMENCIAIAEQIEHETGRVAMPYQVHVGRWDQLDGLVEATYQRFGKVDTLINNAGMSPVYDKLTDVTEKLFDAVVNLNLKGPFRLSALVGERMVAAGRGSIINVSTAGSLRPAPDIIPYAASKAGLNAMTEGLARAFGPTVRVNTLMAGPFLTDVSKSWNLDQATHNPFVHLSLQRAGDPTEIVGAALFLASDASSFTTGSILRADGGFPESRGPGVFEMAWDFSTEPEFEKKLDWIREFVREEVEPLEVLFPGCEFLPLNDERRKIVDPLKQQVREQGLWAPHLGPELGGQGFGAVKLTLINEILGRSPWAPIVFGTQAPDTGNAEIIARFGTQDQKDRYLAGLLSGEIFSCFSMTEPQGGADPRVFTTRAVRDGDDWVITGRKYFSSNASVASFFIVVTITDPDVPVHRGASTFLIPAGTEGLNVAATHHLVGSDPHEPGHSLVHYDGVRVPSDALLGEPGQGFLILQTRLAGGRLHHAMRSIGMAQRAVDMMGDARKAGSLKVARWPISSWCKSSSPTLIPS